MSDNFQSDRPRHDQVQNDNVIIERREPPDTTMPMVVYALYLVSFVVGFTSVIGVVIAYVYRGKGPAWLDEHYRYQIRTFWIGLLYATIASILVLVAIGIPLLIALAVWLIVRCVKGFRGLQEKRAPENVDTWLF
ncbi:DUF4870 domain-containing protein [Halomonas sp. JS92-SW72]|uniref:DUF4870 family protein n=1 Tax=Halomonas sp. JS92-SW72 TaxID=2306583 RepID=UPI000E5B6A92|nr:DUF4870 domain-containing protein [Halomonas sp. JS92-SW72]AXY43031.1 hypothetical protein D1793_12855 [Halomonas sp. JS92-SW72]